LLQQLTNKDNLTEEIPHNTQLHSAPHYNSPSQAHIFSVSL